MVVLSHSQPILDTLDHIKTCTYKSPSNVFKVPVVDLMDPNAMTQVVEACKEYGFFKLINHGVSMEFLNELEMEAVKFFNLSQQEKDKSGPPNPFGYGNKKIGLNGDVGWLEYLLFCVSDSNSSNIPGISDNLRCLVKEYVSIINKMASDVLEMIAEELGLGEKDALSKLIRDEKSDSCFRMNHYPPCPDHYLIGGRNLIGFGEHTDPQIISVVRSNNASGLQICLKDGTWVSVPSDSTSFFLNVGDSLQVMTNGKFRSVKHRVMANGSKSRVSMIYFGGPALSEKITAIKSIMEQGEESVYKEFTWCEYKNAAYKSRLGDNRLRLFEK